MLRDLGAAADPDLWMSKNVVEKPLQGLDAAGSPDDAAVKPH